LPKPLKGESKQKYINRAIPFMIRKEGLTRDEAAGKAYGLWDYFKKKKGGRK